MSKKKLSTEGLEYLKKISESDFYQNDREFIGIVKKLTKQSASIGNKALGLVTVLNEAERIKLKMIEKETSLGLTEKDKPFGQSSPKYVNDHSLIYSSKGLKQETINNFIHNLEAYFKLEDNTQRRNALIDAKTLTSSLKDLGENPKHFIINSERAKVWYILENDYASTLKNFDIDLFIEKIRLTRLQYQNDIDEISSYYENRKKDIIQIKKAHKEENQPEITRLQKNLDQEMNVEMQPLIIDTQKIMNSLDFMLEDIPEELNNEQQEELKQFIPAMSEYYIDQTCKISGGNAYTSLAKNLQHFQKLINKKSPLSVLLKELEELEHSMQHLYILHWIVESLLKIILKNKNSITANTHAYAKEYNDANRDNNFIKAIKIRNDIAHNALIWNPKEISFAIEHYGIYIEKLKVEQKLDFENIVLPRVNQKLSKADLEQKHTKYFNQHLGLRRERVKELDEKLLKKIEKQLEKKNWSLSNKEKKDFNSYIKRAEHDTFSIETFQLNTETVREWLVKHASQNIPNFDDTDFEQKKEVTKSFSWLCFNQKHKDAPRVIQEIQQKLREVT